MGAEDDLRIADGATVVGTVDRQVNPEIQRGNRGGNAFVQQYRNRYATTGFYTSRLVFLATATVAFSVMAWVRVNGEVRQKATGDEMRDSPEKLLKLANKLFDVRDGDLFFSGTPKGVGAILSGDRLELSWGDHLEFAVDFS